MIRSPDPFEQAMGDYRKDRPEAIPDALWIGRYAPILAETRRLPSDSSDYDFPRIGQLAHKAAGTNYEFGSIARAWITEHTGLRVDLMLTDGTISIHEFKFAKPGGDSPIASAAHDPHRLWLPKNRSGSRITQARP